MRGEWIEIGDSNEQMETIQSSPLVRGEWIEITPLHQGHHSHLSPLVRGEWIEIQQGTEIYTCRPRLPS